MSAAMKAVTANEYWDSGTDPIDFFSTRILFDKDKE